MAKERVLVVEDDANILELISYNLAKEGYDVVGLTTGEEAIAKLHKQPPDVVLLDIMLPGMGGFEVCRRIRGDAESGTVPVIMVTAKGEEADVVKGLEAGADDYITKPFSPRVLIARIKAVLRRRTRGAKWNLDAPLLRGDLQIHPGRHEVRTHGKLISLTSTEFQLLSFLASQAGWVFTRAQIVEAIRGSDYHVTDRSIDVLVFGLRKKLGEYAGLVETVRGVGYRFREL